MRSSSVTCTILAVALACLGSCRAAALELTPEDWATSRYEVLFEKASHSPTALRAVMSPERATDPDMKTLVGIVHRVGMGVEKDLVKAAELLSAACEAGQMRACRDYGKVLVEQGDPEQFARAANLFDRSCEAGIVFGCFDMATAYLQGIGVKQDTAKAVPYVDRACAEPAELICAEAANALAEIDSAAGLDRLGLLCDAGSAMACHWSGHQRMQSADASLREAGLKHHEIACSFAIIPSCAAIVIAKDRGGHDPAGLDTALKRLDAACIGGYVEGCYHLGYAYSDQGAPGIPSDNVMTFRYNSAACSHGDPESCRWAAEALETGKGTPQDLAAAADLYHWLCEQGNPRMCQQAARVEVAAAPKGLPGTDVTSAVTERACDLGDGEACRGIGWWHVFGEEGRRKDLALASAHFIKGCDKGAATSCIDLASLQEWAQFGFAQDKASARRFYKRACDLEDPIGCKLLEESARAVP